jgi:NADH:ubiquinone oxidoreductase subunit H
MVLIRDLAIQGAQMLLVLALAPLFTGFVRKVKARLLRRQGPPLIQPYLDLVRLARKEVVLADSASWLFRVIPYLVFAATWVAASLIPTFRIGLVLTTFVGFTTSIFSASYIGHELEIGRLTPPFVRYRELDLCARAVARVGAGVWHSGRACRAVPAAQ